MLRTPSGGYLFDPAGRCIYCGAGGPLTREHIVPFGLFGDLVLPAASCRGCQEVTSGLETFVLKRMLGVTRTKYGFRSQNSRKRRRQDGASIRRIERDGSRTEIPLETDQLPFHSWALPVFNTPALAWQAPYEDVVRDDKLEFRVGRDDAETALEAGGGLHPIEMPVGVYDPQKFTRFLAKVAHGYACAVLGVDGFPHLLGEFVRSGHEQPRIFVGGELDIEEPRPTIYELALGTTLAWNGQRFLGVRMRFLSFLGTPTYTAVVSEHLEQEIELPDHAAYEKPIKVTVKGRNDEVLFRSG